VLALNFPRQPEQLGVYHAAKPVAAPCSVAGHAGTGFHANAAGAMSGHGF